MKTIVRPASNAAFKPLALLTSAAALILSALPASAQQSLTAVIIRGRAVLDRAAQPGPTVLSPGLRVESPAGTWTEIAFSDGSSVVLEPGSDFTLRGIERDTASGRTVVRAVAGHGRLRVSTSDDVDIVIVTLGAEVRVSRAAAVVDAGQEGSATLTSGRSVTVRRADGQEDVIRRPGFSVAFENGGPRRQTREQLAEAVEPFAPVASSRGRQRRQGGAEVAQAGSSSNRPSRSDIGQSLIVAPPPPDPPPPRQTPEQDRPLRRSGGSFDLASALLPPSSAQGSNFAAPRPNSGTSTVNTAPLGSDPNSQEPSVNIIRIESSDYLPTGRIRRFAPSESGALNARTDTGVVTGVGANPSGTVVTSLYQPLSRITLPQTPTQTFYDGIANVGVVTLRIWQPTAQSAFGDEYDGIIVPRLSISDSTRPSSVLYYTDIQQSGGPPLDPSQPPVIPGNIIADPYSGGSDARRIYRGSGVIETDLHEVDISQYVTRIIENVTVTTPERDVAATPVDGRISRLGGGNGSFVYVGPALNATRFIPLDGAVGEPQSEYLMDENGARLAREDTPAAATVRTVAPQVFIVDKITASNEAIINERSIQPGERFFVIGGTPLAAPANGGLPGTQTGRVSRFAVSDGINPIGIDQQGGFRSNQTIEAQFNAPGSPTQPRAFNSYNAFRPEETFVAGVVRGDTHLLVIAGEADRNPAMRVDLQVARDGRTSAGVSTGAIARLPAGDRSLALSGTTVGSSRSGQPGTPAEMALKRSSTSIMSNLGSLGAGTATDPTAYSGHLFGGNSFAPGQIGYFAVGQADTRRGSPEDPINGPQPGTVATIDGNSTNQFAFTRLATNVGAPALAAQAGAIEHQGFAAGLVEAAPGAGQSASIHAVVGAGLGDVRIRSRDGNREFDATIRLAPRAPGEILADGSAAPAPAGRVERTLLFGFDGNSGATPTTAVASQGTFAGVIRNQAAMASVDGDVIQGVQDRAGLQPSNEHIAWGFFLGDLVAQSNGSPREYANLSFWVAGRPVDYATLQNLTGVATYQGGMIGNVVDAAGLRTATGAFNHQFNFGTRQGNFGSNFDNAAHTIGTQLGGAGVFSGSGDNPQGRTLSVQGGFFHNPAIGGALGPSNLPAATGGVFGITGPGYGANGVFVGAQP